MAESTFDDITERLDEIIATVRSKDTSLERSLDLFDEAIELGSRAVDMVDSFELSPREADMLDAQDAEEGAAGDSADAAQTQDANGSSEDAASQGTETSAAADET